MACKYRKEHLIISTDELLKYSSDLIAIFLYVTVNNGLAIGGGEKYISVILFHSLFKCVCLL